MMMKTNAVTWQLIKQLNMQVLMVSILFRINCLVFLTIVLEVLLLWKGVFCLYSLSFLDQKYRDSILYSFDQYIIFREQIQNAQSEMVKESLLNSNESLKILSLPPVSVDNLADIYQTITNAEISQKEVFHSLLSANVLYVLIHLRIEFPIFT